MKTKQKIFTIIEVVFLLIFTIASTLLAEEVVYYANSSAADHSTVGDRTIKSLAEAIGTTKKATIVLSHDSKRTITRYSVGSSITLTPNISLRIAKGAIIAVPAGATLTANGILEAGDYQIFTTDVTTTAVDSKRYLKLSNCGFVKLKGKINAKWFGIVANSNGTTGNGTDNTWIFNWIGQCLQNGNKVYIPSSNGLYYRVSGVGHSVSPLVAIVVMHVQVDNIEIYGDKGTQIFLDGFSGRDILTSNYYGSGTYVFLRFFKLPYINNCSAHDLSFLGQWTLNEEFPTARGTADRCIAVNMMQTINGEAYNLKGNNICGNLFNSSMAGGGAGCKNLKIHDNYSNACSESGFNMMGGNTHVTFSNNTAIDCHSLVESAAHDSVISNNVCEVTSAYNVLGKVTGVREALGIQNIGNNVKITNNKIKGYVNKGKYAAMKMGILLRNQGGAAYDCQNAIVSNNVVEGAGYAGIWASVGSNVAVKEMNITGNIVRNIGYDASKGSFGVYITGTNYILSNLTVAMNTITPGSLGAYGLSIKNTDGSNITGNHMDCPKYCIIQDTGAVNRINVSENYLHTGKAGTGGVPIYLPHGNKGWSFNNNSGYNGNIKIYNP